MVSELDTWLSGGYLQKFFSTFRTNIPAEIISYDSASNTASVKLLIQDIDGAGNPLPGEVTLSSVPCLMFGGAQNYLSTGLSAGDHGLLMVCDRDIDNYKASRALSPVASIGVANLKDAIFMPGLSVPGVSGAVINSNTQVVVQCGASTATLTPSQIELKNGDVTLVLTSSGVVINGDLTVNGSINATETLTATGNIILEPGADIAAGGLSYRNHVHGGVATGTGETGIPQ